LGNLATPASVQKLQMALHAKAKAEPGFRFYALYDKISRDDILAHAWAQCRSNKGAPGVDGQDFADIEAYGVQRWLGELALALREEAYRPDPIRRVFIPKANGKLRPLGISTLRDRVCMTAAMLVLGPIFEADLPPEQYAYRPGRNAQQAAMEVKDTLFYGHPEVVDADLADYFGSIPHAELMLSLARRRSGSSRTDLTVADRPPPAIPASIYSRRERPESMWSSHSSRSHAQRAISKAARQGSATPASMKSCSNGRRLANRIDAIDPLLPVVSQKSGRSQTLVTRQGKTAAQWHHPIRWRAIGREGPPRRGQRRNLDGKPDFICLTNAPILIRWRWLRAWRR